MWTDLLRPARARLRGAPKARGRRGTPAAPFRSTVEALDGRCLPSAQPGVSSPAELAALHLQPGHLGLPRAFQWQLHLGPLYAALPDLGAGQAAAAPNTFGGRSPGRASSSPWRSARGRRWPACVTAPASTTGRWPWPCRRDPPRASPSSMNDSAVLATAATAR
jgi:hypothetical protein